MRSNKSTQKPFEIKGLLNNKTEYSVKVVKAGVLTEIYLTEKFDRQSKSAGRSKVVPERRPDSALRARRMVRWLSVSNAQPKSSYFFTATFADDVKSYDDGLCRWKKFIRKLKKEYPQLVYIAVPEVQPRSGRWHFHAIFCNMPNVKSMKKTYGKMLNRDHKLVDAWQWHFTKVWSQANGNGKIHRSNIEVARSVAGVCRYLGKYLTKDVGGTVPIGRRNYYAGGRNLCYPEITDYPEDIPKYPPEYQTSYKDALGREVFFARFLQIA